MSVVEYKSVAYKKAEYVNPANWFLGNWQIVRTIKHFSARNSFSPELSLLSLEKLAATDLTAGKLDAHKLLSRVQYLEIDANNISQIVKLNGQATFMPIEFAESTTASVQDTRLQYKEVLHYTLYNKVNNNVHNQVHNNDNKNNRSIIKAEQAYQYCFRAQHRPSATLTICFQPKSWLSHPEPSKQFKQNGQIIANLGMLAEQPKPFCSINLRDFLQGKSLLGKSVIATPHLCGEDYYFVTLQNHTRSIDHTQAINHIQTINQTQTLNQATKCFSMSCYVIGPKKHYITHSLFSNTPTSLY